MSLVSVSTEFCGGVLFSATSHLSSPSSLYAHTAGAPLIFSLFFLFLIYLFHLGGIVLHIPCLLLFSSKLEKVSLNTCVQKFTYTQSSSSLFRFVIFHSLAIYCIFFLFCCLTWLPNTGHGLYILLLDAHATDVHTKTAHINHIRRVAGIDHVGIGAGYDGINTYVTGRISLIVVFTLIHPIHSYSCVILTFSACRLIM